MLLADTELEQFWQAAAAAVPLVIMGGGRWGRTWSIAASRARGSGTGITIAARTDPLATRDWALGDTGVSDLRVVGSLSEALEQADAPVLAIIASRPRDHVRDGIEALGRGLDILVEKPVSDHAQAGMALLALARERGRLIAVGTEFALLPGFHSCAREILQNETQAQRVRLFWDDPVQDFRHGAVKNQHVETGVLIDLLPHACSIFRLYAGSSALRLDGLRQDSVAESGFIRFGDEHGGQYELHCNKQSGVRRRLLEVETSTRKASVDFAAEVPSVMIDGVARIYPETLHMRSTLRLALGAFVAERTQRSGTTPISQDIEGLLGLQADVEDGLRRAPSA